MIQTVRCAGALPPDALGTFAERGASEIRMLGCAPSECRYGTGNTLAAERLAGDRRPHPARRHARSVVRDWVSSDRAVAALADPGAHPDLDTTRPPARREALAGVGVIAVLTVIGVAFATRVPFASSDAGAAVRVVVDHRAGAALAVDAEERELGAIDAVEISVTVGRGGPTVTSLDGPAGDRWAEIIDLEPLALGDARSARLVVSVEAQGRPITVVDRALDLSPDRWVIVDLTDRPARPGVDDGHRIFTTRAGGCSVCHSVDEGDDGVGPSLHGVATVAGSRVEGLDAEGYLRQSILLPDQYVLDGWRSGQMLPIYRERLSEAELDAVIAYLLTLDEEDR